MTRGQANRNLRASARRFFVFAVLSWWAVAGEARVVNAVISGGSKLIRNHTYDLPRATRELYDLGTDAGERDNLAPDRRVTAGYLEMLLRQAAETNRYEAPTAELSAEDEERLRALGYLE